jgi:hypothetical protein
MDLSSYRLNRSVSSSDTKVISGEKDEAKWSRGVIGAAKTARIIRSNEAGSVYAAFR